MKSSFHQDTAWSRAVRDRILCPLFYARYSMQGRYVLVDKGRFATMLQRYNAVDTICQGKDGKVVPIEEKIVRWPGYEHLYFALETHSCTVPGHETPGWMQYGQADWLLYCYMQEDGNTIVCYLIDFQNLKPWFWRSYRKFDQFGPLNTSNRTVGRKVPIVAVRDAVQTIRLVLTDPKASPQSAPSPAPRIIYPNEYHEQTNFLDSLLSVDRDRAKIAK